MLPGCVMLVMMLVSLTLSRCFPKKIIGDSTILSVCKPKDSHREGQPPPACEDALSQGQAQPFGCINKARRGHIPAVVLCGQGLTVLHKAAASGHAPIVKCLLRQVTLDISKKDQVSGDQALRQLHVL